MGVKVIPKLFFEILKEHYNIELTGRLHVVNVPPPRVSE